MSTHTLTSGVFCFFLGIGSRCNGRRMDIRVRENLSTSIGSMGGGSGDCAFALMEKESGSHRPSWMRCNKRIDVPIDISKHAFRLFCDYDARAFSCVVRHWRRRSLCRHQGHKQQTRQSTRSWAASLTGLSTCIRSNSTSREERSSKHMENAGLGVMSRRRRASVAVLAPQFRLSFASRQLSRVCVCVSWICAQDAGSCETVPRDMRVHSQVPQPRTASRVREGMNSEPRVDGRACRGKG